MTSTANHGARRTTAHSLIEYYGRAHKATPCKMRRGAPCPPWSYGCFLETTAHHGTHPTRRKVPRRHRSNRRQRPANKPPTPRTGDAIMRRHGPPADRRQDQDRRKWPSKQAFQAPRKVAPMTFDRPFDRSSIGSIAHTNGTAIAPSIGFERVFDRVCSIPSHSYGVRNALAALVAAVVSVALEGAEQGRRHGAPRRSVHDLHGAAQGSDIWAGTHGQFTTRNASAGRAGKLRVLGTKVDRREVLSTPGLRFP